MMQLSLLERSTDQVVVADAADCNRLLEAHHYLGPLAHARLWLGWYSDQGLEQCQAWRSPTSRLVPQDWLELSRWCIAGGGRNAGSRFHGQAVRVIRQILPEVTHLVSYSELGRHTGALYKSCNWQPLPTHHADRYLLDGVGYPSGHGSWDGVTVQAPKMRWVFEL